MLSIHDKLSAFMNLFMEMPVDILIVCAGVWCDRVRSMSISLKWAPCYLSTSLPHFRGVVNLLEVLVQDFFCEVSTHTILIDLLNTDVTLIHLDISSRYTLPD
jgi:hypothetical protein